MQDLFRPCVPQGFASVSLLYHNGSLTKVNHKETLTILYGKPSGFFRPLSVDTIETHNVKLSFVVHYDILK